jgi:hypothetical protein
MKCDQCKEEMTSRQATAENPYKYELGGGFC